MAYLIKLKVELFLDELKEKIDTTYVCAPSTEAGLCYGYLCIRLEVNSFNLYTNYNVKVTICCF